MSFGHLTKKAIEERKKKDSKRKPGEKSEGEIRLYGRNWKNRNKKIYSHNTIPTLKAEMDKRLSHTKMRKILVLHRLRTGIEEILKIDKDLQDKKDL